MIYTVGHSTLAADRFAELLAAHEIRQLADIRTVPKSRRHPHFAREALDPFLARHAITYRHFPSLGGLRKPRPDSINTAWQNDSFRGYADYMQTDAFEQGVSDLLTFAQTGRTAVMCAEAVPWRCHRSLIADALLIRGWVIRHIMTKTKADTHRLTPFAVVAADRITYPSASPSVES